MVLPGATGRSSTTACPALQRTPAAAGNDDHHQGLSVRLQRGQAQATRAAAASVIMGTR